MTVVKEAIHKGLMTGIDEDILQLDPNQEYIILHKIPIAGKTITTIKVAAGSQDLKVHPDILPGDPDLHPDQPVEIKTDILVTDDLVIFCQRMS